MPPTVILIRHGEALHNIDDDWQLRDPVLTDEGVAQCKRLAQELKSKYSFTTEDTLIVVSPFQRTLQTFRHGLGWLQEQGVPVKVRAEWQEVTAHPCDVGLEFAEIAPQWPDLDFSELDPVYPAKTGIYQYSEEVLLQRAHLARSWLFERKEKLVIVVTHSGFLKRTVKGTKYANTEFRTYEFKDKKSASQDYELVQVDAKQPTEQEVATPAL
ncbi:histidine phosphatase superfamily [Pseudomassariella vexata]|uniref:Histidine phosphatase superfamily n=1 Tax=Pseudomassariella vexata TaxID=1141098 RepID=A0A1Y2E324_9PEZI|nr:histidine phosphatase superfamily [Pseudomassariella vexata]ORY65847.1 histidine phosphatase superfamily [Pseudomassariella vexata]